ncbi:MAG: PEP-CTERM sorting domain-containing protein [Methylobacter sp.]
MLINEPSILSLGGVIFGDPSLGDQLALGQSAESFFTPRDGSVNLVELSFDTVADLSTLQADSFTLATLSFNALTAGVSPLNISLNAIGDANGDPLPIETITAGSVTVEANANGSVPEPATWLLVSLGVLVMNRFSWRLLGQKYFLPVFRLAVNDYSNVGVHMLFAPTINTTSNLGGQKNLPTGLYSR